MTDITMILRTFNQSLVTVHFDTPQQAYEFCRHQRSLDDVIFIKHDGVCVFSGLQGDRKSLPWNIVMDYFRCTEYIICDTPPTGSISEHIKHIK